MQVTKFSRVREWPGRVQSIVLAAIMVLALTPRSLFAQQELPQDTNQTPAVQETPDHLQQLVAPIALYPDALVAQILAAATYPTEVVQADRWLQQHQSLQGEQLAATVDQQPWDQSVKALTAFPSVLANLDKNLSWTEGLGNAYFNQQQDVLDAVQVMRRRAEDAGNLQTTQQQRVVNDGPTIVIEPAYQDVCYVPVYDPWVVYGAPLAIYPGYFSEAWYGPPFVTFGPAIGLGFFNGFGWGWPAWGFNWGSRVVVFNHNPYVSRSRYFFHHGPFNGTPGVGARRWNGSDPRINRGFNNRTAGTPAARFGSGWANRGPGAPRAGTGSRDRGVNGFRPGGNSRGSVFSGGSSGGRSGVGGRSFGGGSRSGGLHGGGSRGGGGGGRHR